MAGGAAAAVIAPMAFDVMNKVDNYIIREAEHDKKVSDIEQDGADTQAKTTAEGLSTDVNGIIAVKAN